MTSHIDRTLTSHAFVMPLLFKLIVLVSSVCQKHSNKNPTNAINNGCLFLEQNIQTYCHILYVSTNTTVTNVT